MQTSCPAVAIRRTDAITALERPRFVSGRTAPGGAEEVPEHMLEPNEPTQPGDVSATDSPVDPTPASADTAKTGRPPRTRRAPAAPRIRLAALAKELSRSNREVLDLLIA